MKEISCFERMVLTFWASVISFGLFLVHFQREYFDTGFTIEDGPVEWLTVFFLLAGAVLCIKRFVFLRKKRNKIFLLSLLILTGLFIFGAGEEISWGQRLTGHGVPEFFAKHNSQGETNFHNLVVAGVKINKLFFGSILSIVIVFYFLILPFIYEKVSFLSRMVTRFALPLPRMYHVLAYLILAAIVLPMPSSKKGEMLEFGGVVIFFLLCFNPKNSKLFN